MSADREPGAGRNNLLTFFFLFLLAGLLAAHLLGCAAGFPLAGPDASSHLVHTVEIYYRLQDIVSDSSLSLGEKILALLRLQSAPLPGKGVWHANLSYLPAALVYAVSGIGLAAARSSNAVYLVVLAASVFLLGNRLGGRATGAAAAFTVLAYPLIFESSRQYGLDLPLTALTAMAVFLLLKTDHFKITLHSAAAGAAVGAAMLIKIQAVIFLLAPGLVLLVGAVRRAVKNDSHSGLASRFCNLALLVCIAAAISYLWWGVHWDELLWAIEHIMKAAFPVPPRTSLLGLSSYAGLLAFLPVGLPLFAFFLPALIAFTLYGPRDKWVYLAWLAFPLYYFAFETGAYDLRYLMPLLPPIALITVWGLFRLNSSLLRTGGLLGLAGYLAAQFYCLTFPAAPRAPFAPFLFSPGTDFKRTAATRGDHGFPGLLETLTACLPAGNERVSVLTVLLDGGLPDAFEVQYRVYSANRRFEVYDYVKSFDVRTSAPNYDFEEIDVFLLRAASGSPTGVPDFAELSRILERGTDRFLFSLMRPRMESSYSVFSGILRGSRIAATLPTADFTWTVYTRKRRK